MSANPYTNPSTKRGATLDTYFIVDGRSVSLRDLWERGLVQPGSRVVTQGQAPFLYTVTVYEAVFTDRNRQLLITPETHAVLSGEAENDAQASNVLDEDELLNVQANTSPTRVDEQETYWHGVDGPDVNPDPISLYDLEPQVEEVVEESP